MLMYQSRGLILTYRSGGLHGSNHSCKPHPLGVKGFSPAVEPVFSFQ